MAVRGGQRIKRLAREMRARRVNLPLIEIGFKDRRIAALAATHEFGLEDAEGKVRIPERPAFRNGIGAMQRAASREVKRIATSGPRPFKGFTSADAEIIGRVALDSMLESYRNFEGAPLSERQEARKAGTPGAGRQLIGHRGERMLEHLGLWIDGQRVA